jgi:uncharacterized protein YybS (DUF2232 family)
MRPGFARQWVAGGAAGFASAFLLLAGSVFGSPGAVLLMYLSPLPLAMAGLAAGMPALVGALIIGTGVTVLRVGELGFGHLVVAGLPVAVLVRQALLARGADGAGEKAPDVVGGMQWYPLGWLAAWLAGMAALLLLVAALLASGEPGGLAGWFEVRLTAIAEQLKPNLSAVAPGANLADAVPGLARTMPTLIAIIWMVVIAANMALAQGVVAKFGRNLRPSPRFEELVLPHGCGLALAAAAVLSFLPGDFGPVGAALLAVMCMAYLFQGLAVLHAAARRTPMPGVILAGMYVVVIVLGFPALLIVGLGVLDDWFRFRRRFGGGRPGQEV